MDSGTTVRKILEGCRPQCPKTQAQGLRESGSGDENGEGVKQSWEGQRLNKATTDGISGVWSDGLGELKSCMVLLGLAGSTVIIVPHIYIKAHLACQI